MSRLRSKKNLSRHHPGLAELTSGPAKRSQSLISLKSTLVSPRFGIVKALATVEPDPTEPGAPFVVQAQLANHRYLSKEEADQFGASGKGFTFDRAIEGALGEAIERYSASFWWPDDIRRCRRTDLAELSLDPMDLVLFDHAQYESVPYQPYADDTVLGWVRAQALIADQPIWVPALSVFLTYPATGAEMLFPTTSNGLAAGSSLEHAVLAAALEIIERDAVMIGWLNRLCLGRWSPVAHPRSEIRGLVEAYRRRGVEIGLFRMPTDVHGVTVFLAVARDPRNVPAAVVGLGADFDTAEAAAKAITEIAQVRPALRRKLRTPETQRRLAELVADPRRVTSLHDHDLLYAHAQSLSKLDFLWDQTPDAAEWSAAPAVGLADLASSLKVSGHELIYYNLSVPEIEKLKVSVARAIIPMFQPIDFGWNERRLGGHRVLQLPVALGLSEQPNSITTLNPDPHPIA